MRKKLLSGLFWMMLANLLIKPFWLLGIDLGVQKSVGTETYGFYLVVFNLAYIFNILLDFGITNFNTRSIARNPALIKKHLSGILALKVLLFALYVVVTFTVSLILGYDSRQFYLLAWLCFNQFLNSLIIYLRSNFQGLLMFKTDSLLSILDRLLMIVICSVLLWGPFGQSPFKIEWFVYAQTVAYIIAAVGALAMLFKKVGFQSLRWNKPFSIAILRKSAPFALLVLLMASYNRLDPVLLQKLLPETGNYQAGIYGAAFRLLDALTMLAFLVSVPLLPIFSKLTKSCKSQPSSSLELKATAKMMFSLMFVVTYSIAIACVFFGNEILQLLYGTKVNVEEVNAVFCIIVLGFIPIGMTYVFGTLLTANGNLRQLNLLAAVALALNISVNLALIPRYGAVGAAYASLAAQTFMGAAQMALSYRLFRFRPTPRFVLQVVAYGGLVFLVCWFLATLGLPQGTATRLSPWVSMCLMAVAAIALAFLLKLIDLKEILSVLLSKERE
ncbi:MAG: oligosaccharide flippase family protein [Bacteroidales bacterium]|nr:oligosaccharide flippase family protein [Bacteroidales bacterium]